MYIKYSPEQASICTGVYTISIDRPSEDEINKMKAVHIAYTSKTKSNTSVLGLFNDTTNLIVTGDGLEVVVDRGYPTIVSWRDNSNDGGHWSKYIQPLLTHVIEHDVSGGKRRTHITSKIGYDGKVEYLPEYMDLNRDGLFEYKFDENLTLECDIPMWMLVTKWTTDVRREVGKLRFKIDEDRFYSMGPSSFKRLTYKGKSMDVHCKPTPFTLFATDVPEISLYDSGDYNGYYQMADHDDMGDRKFNSEELAEIRNTLIGFLKIKE